MKWELWLLALAALAGSALSYGAGWHRAKRELTHNLHCDVASVLNGQGYVQVCYDKALKFHFDRAQNFQDFRLRSAIELSYFLERAPK
jgi:hypothetical protein